MGGIGQNLQLPSDGSEILCALRAPLKTYAYQILWQNMSYFESYGEKWVCQTLKIWVYVCIIQLVGVIIFIYLYYHIFLQLEMHACILKLLIAYIYFWNDLMRFLEELWELYVLLVTNNTYRLNK